MVEMEATPVQDDSYPCPICGAALLGQVKKCLHCGEWINRHCEVCSTPLKGVFAARGLCASCAEARHSLVSVSPAPLTVERKSKGVAILLTFFLGGFGIHRFYLNRPGSGVMYLLFCWTFIPALIAFLEVFRLAFMSDTVFQQKYSR
jgi:TM2 domain-containing membrane protein YozV